MNCSLSFEGFGGVDKFVYETESLVKGTPLSDFDDAVKCSFMYKGVLLLVLPKI